jgi:RNA polymerase sigma-70 factor (ECF subfamily)
MEAEENFKTLPDEIVLTRAISEPGMFEVLVDRYEAAFRNAARRIVGVEDAEDAVQETFVRMYIHAPKYIKKDGSKFSSWAYAILVRVCYSIYSKNKRRETFTIDKEVADELEDFSIKELREYRMDKEYLLSLISKLPSLLKRTLELYIFDHKSEKEIAELEGVTHGVVRTRISRAKDKLKLLNLTYYTRANDA